MSMNFSKLTSLLSSVGASLAVGVGSMVAHAAMPPVEKPDRQAASSPAPQSWLNATVTGQMASPLPKPTIQPTPSAQLQSQRQYLAENPLCQLATEALNDPPEAIAHNNVTQVPAQLSGFMSGFLRKLVQVMGLERWLQPQAVPTPKVAVIPKPLTATEQRLTAQPVSSHSNVQLVSHTQGVAHQTRDYQLWVKGHPIANIRTQDKANYLAQRLERLIDTTGFNAALITPKLYQEQPAIAMGDQILFIVDETLTRQDAINYEVLAIQWANNLRLAFGVPALDLVTAQQQMYQLEETHTSLEGLASWYGPYFHGRLTANGETYDQYAFTAAHPSMPLDTYLKVTNLNNDKSVIIRLNDRGPYIEPRSLDLSLGAARCLNSVDTGVIPYKATIMKRRPAIATEAI